MKTKKFQQSSHQENNVGTSTAVYPKHPPPRGKSDIARWSHTENVNHHLHSFRERMPAAVAGRGGDIWSLASPFSAWWGRRKPPYSRSPILMQPLITYQQTPNRPQQTPTCEQKKQFLPVVGKRLFELKDVKLGKDKVRHGLDGERLDCVNYHDWVMGETGLVQLRGIVFPSSTTSTSHLTNDLISNEEVRST